MTKTPRAELPHETVEGLPVIGSARIRALTVRERLQVGEVTGGELLLTLLEIAVDNDYTADDWNVYCAVHQAEGMDLYHRALRLSSLDSAGVEAAEKK